MLGGGWVDKKAAAAACVALRGRGGHVSRVVCSNAQCVALYTGWLAKYTFRSGQGVYGTHVHFVPVAVCCACYWICACNLGVRYDFFCWAEWMPVCCSVVVALVTV